MIPSLRRVAAERSQNLPTRFRVVWIQSKHCHRPQNGRMTRLQTRSIWWKISGQQPVVGASRFDMAAPTEMRFPPTQACGGLSMRAQTKGRTFLNCPVPLRTHPSVSNRHSQAYSAELRSNPPDGITGWLSLWLQSARFGQNCR